MNMIKRVSLALAEADGATVNYDVLAIAAIEAMREPTGEMTRANAGTCTTNARAWNSALYNAMIDIALEGK